MNGENAQDSIFTMKLVEIALGKNEEIIDLIKSKNKIRSNKDFREIEERVSNAISDGDLELIEILLSETIEDKSLGMSFKINRTNKTASLFRVSKQIFHLVIPRSIKYEEYEYLITSIACLSIVYYSQINVQTISFEENSAVKTIYGKSLASSIRVINIPSSLTELKEGWCSGTDNLENIIVSSDNDRFIFKNGKYLLGKTDNKSDNFDKLLFARRDISSVIIPSNIKVISSYAFNKCQKFGIVQFEPNSQLQTIEKYAFLSSHFREIHIPPSVLKICSYAFFICYYLTMVKIPPNSNLQTIEKRAFESTQIKEIYFPSKLIELDEEWCFDVIELNKIIVSSENNAFVFKDNKYLLGKTDNNNNDFDKFLFLRKDIKNIVIPSNIKIISSFAFFQCKKLTEIKFEPNSNLQTIKKCAFRSTSIKEIHIPSSVTKICSCAFAGCQKLEKIEILPNSNLQIIEESAFESTNINEIYLPSHLRELKEGWCCYTNNLKKIIISSDNDRFIFKNDKYLLGKTDNKSDNFDKFLFARRDINNVIIIKSNIKMISSHAFYYCQKLKKIEFESNSNLLTIGNAAFAHTNINEITIPSSVSKIFEYAFFDCKSLKRFKFTPNSKLQTIGRYAFASSNIKEIFIPSSVSIIGEYSFSECKCLQIIEISDGSNLQILSKFAFSGCFNAILMAPQSLNDLFNSYQMK